MAWAVDQAAGPVYIRLVSIPWELPFEPAGDVFEPGRGKVIREGADIVLAASGPVMLAEAYKACAVLERRDLDVGLISLPWLRDIDGDRLADAAADAPLLCLDNHYVAGGQGEAIRAALATSLWDVRVEVAGVMSVPACGTNGRGPAPSRPRRRVLADRAAELIPARD